LNIKIELTKKEATERFGNAISKELFGGKLLRIVELDWSNYGTRVSIEVTDEPEKPEEKE
jgi:hypothetical protein